MAEHTEREHCTICGDSLNPSENRDALCQSCTDAWERENESHW